jgi:hypothetical protein
MKELQLDGQAKLKPLHNEELKFQGSSTLRAVMTFIFKDRDA